MTGTVASADTAATSPTDGTLTEVAPGVHAWVQPDGGWCLNNAGFVDTARGGVLVDTAATERRARRLAEQVHRVAGHLPSVVVNTHHHGDHQFGNHVFAAGATIIAHHQARKEMIAAGLGMTRIWPGADWGTIDLVPPDVTFTGRMTLHDDELPVELVHIGPAHTTNDVVAWVPDRGVLFTGDLVFAGGTPFLLMGSVRGWLDAVAELRAFGASVIVPGHGPVSGPEVLDETEDYLRWLSEVARRGHAAGRTPWQLAQETDLGRYAALGEPERLVGNLHRAYAELDGAAPGADIDVLEPMREMFAFNGGRLPCRA